MAKLAQVVQDNLEVAPVNATAAEPVMEFDNAAVRVGGRQLWAGVTLSVQAGQFVALLGPNGAGKTTLIKVALGLQPLSAGRVTILGRPPGRANHEIGYLPQRRTFDASLRVRGIDIVRLGLDGHRWGLPLPRRDGNAQRIAEVIELVGASDYAHRPVGQVSGGEQQRLLIAQALVRNPRLLILDEPLDSLDLPNQAAVAGLISQICKQRGVAVLMAAHDVNPILTYLDQVIYIAPGGAVAGPPEQVVTSATLSRLYRTPIEVLRTSDGRLVVVGIPEAPCLHSDRHCLEARKARA